MSCWLCCEKTDELKEFGINNLICSPCDSYTTNFLITHTGVNRFEDLRIKFEHERLILKVKNLEKRVKELENKALNEKFDL